MVEMSYLGSQLYFPFLPIERRGENDFPLFFYDSIPLSLLFFGLYNGNWMPYIAVRWFFWRQKENGRR